MNLVKLVLSIGLLICVPKFNNQQQPISIQIASDGASRRI